MQDRTVVRRLYRLAERISRNAEQVRNARLPHHLKPSKARLRRHILELDHILGRRKDNYTASRRRGRPDLRGKGPAWSSWYYRSLSKARRENYLLESGYPARFVQSLR